MVTYSTELGDKICELLAEGNSLRSICKMEGMPVISTVLKWVVMGERGDEVYKPFAEQYAHAREAQAELIFDEMVDIADDSSGDATRNGDGRIVMDSEFAQRSKIRIETRKWVLGRMKPKKFGEKTTLEHTGKDGNAIQYEDVGEEARSALLSKLLAGTSGRRDQGENSESNEGGSAGATV